MTAAESLVQVGCALGQHVDTLVQVAVAGGLTDTGVAGQAGQAATITEPAQNQRGLAERAERAGALRGADPAAVGGQQPGEELDDVARDVERGGMGNQREAPGVADDLVVRPVLPGASPLSAARGPPPDPQRRERLTRIRETFRRENLTGGTARNEGGQPAGDVGGHGRISLAVWVR